MYISKDNFSYASTRYCKSSGLSVTPSLSPILGSHWATAGSIRLFTSPWQDSYSSSSCVLKFKAKEKAQASFLVILAKFPIVTLMEPAFHHMLILEPVIEDERVW